MQTEGAMKQQVLMVEDDVAIGAMVVDVLRLEGFEVTVVGHGREVLQALRTQAYETVILDVMLPDMDGISIMRAIRSDPATASIPVVMLTAKTDDETAWEGWKAGCDYYMTKPFDPTELVATLRRLRPVAAQGTPSQDSLEG
jgi:DNA-binding response OmpR family regulator